MRKTIALATGIIAFALTLGAIGCAFSSENATERGVAYNQGATPEPTAISTLSVTTEPTALPTPSPTPEAPPPTTYLLPCGPAAWAPIDEPTRPVLDWSRNGAYILFNAGNVIYRAASDGSSLNIITDADRSADIDNSSEMVLGMYAEASPDGSRIVYATCEYATEDAFRDDFSRHYFPDYRDDFLSYDYEIAAINMDGSNPGRLTQNLAIDHYPAWSPDGSAIAFISGRDRNDRYHKGGLKLTNSDGTHVRDLHGAAFYSPRWSPDGERIAFIGYSSRNIGATALHTATRDGGRIRDMIDAAGSPSWSPDGRRLAFVSATEDGLLELRTIAEDGGDVRKVYEFDKQAWNYRAMGVSWSPSDSGFIVATYSPYPEAFVIGHDGSVIQRFVESYAEWSADGERIAVVAWFGHVGYTRAKPPGNVWLYTVDPDGSDRRELVIIGDDGEPRAANP